ncbi:hypothetical protein ACB092_05G123400 [Castanea dentata]
MATPSLSQASLFQPKPSLLNPNTLQNQNANSRLFAHHNHLSITLPLKTRNGLVSNSKASLTVQPNVNSTVPIKKCDSPIIVIDNYDSFTYNPVYGRGGCYFEVYWNDEITVDELKKDESNRNPDIPRVRCTPRFLDIVANRIGTWTYCAFIWHVHGFAMHWRGIWCPFTAGRYHSLVIEKESFPGDELEITAWTEDGLVMAARHKKYKHLQGVQFHPESIISIEGKTIVRNFVKQIERREAESRIEG